MRAWFTSRDDAAKLKLGRDSSDGNMPASIGKATARLKIRAIACRVVLT